MAEDGQDGPDLETLQAQIDMSMAFTQNIVSGWMKSSKAKLPSSSRSEDKELEEYMRKPPRLGVGASAPEATGVLSRESAKLRHKLAGKGKKREREEADEPTRPGGATTAAAELDEDEEEESRARVITKKARVDPFAAKGEGKKKKNKGGPAAAPAPRKKPVSSARPAATGGGEDAEMNEAGEGAVGAKSPESGAALPAPSKKKRKKKHKGGAGHDAPPGGPNSEQWTETAATVHEKDVASRSGPTGISVLSTTTPSAPSPSKHLADAVSRANPTKPSVQSPSPVIHAPATSPKASPSTRQLPPNIPLLNLSGPPPAAGEAHSDAPKKKRKRKKKKKKGIAQPAATDDRDTMHEDDGSDDD
ncbi:hypothetical protein C8Q78DRAFT_61851 [Trametes maxima]|nr:hypothetical protein C8Q78DRAFT_61851 [Trametes maxima]